MKKYFSRGGMAVMAIWLAAVTCNMPAATPQATFEFNKTPVQDFDVAATAGQMALTMAASAAPLPTSTPEATSVPPTATQCQPIVAANMNANVRTGPSTDYEVIGFIPTGGTAHAAGQNDNKTWWYIEFIGGLNGHAWVSGSVTTAACITTPLQIVAAPLLPPTPTFIGPASGGCATPIGGGPTPVGCPTWVSPSLRLRSSPTPVSVPTKVRGGPILIGHPSPTPIQ
jgi:hypothetical protein